MSNLQSRIWHWTNDQPEPAFVDKWRTPGRTKFLVATYFTALALALVLELAALWWIHFIWFFFIALLVAITSWTLLRSTINSKDGAPREVLDDYEQAVLDTWRARALNALSALLIVGAFAMIILGVVFDDEIPTAAFGAVSGMYMIFSYLAVTTLPAIGFALTFNQPTED